MSGELSGYRTRENAPRLFQRLISLTLISTAIQAKTEMIFAMVDVLADDILVSITPFSIAAGQATINVVPSRVSSAGNIAIAVANLTSLITSTQAAQQYNVVLLRR